MVKIDFLIGKTKYRFWSDAHNYMFGKYLCVDKKTGNEVYNAEAFYSTITDAVEGLYSYKTKNTDASTFDELLKSYTDALKWIKCLFPRIEVTN